MTVHLLPWWLAIDRGKSRYDAAITVDALVLRPGQYPSLEAMGLNNRISSVREIGRDARIDERRYAPAPIAAPNYRQRKDERLFEVGVTSVHAVVGTPEKRCWIEREQAPQNENQVTSATFVSWVPCWAAFLVIRLAAAPARILPLRAPPLRGP